MKKLLLILIILLITSLAYASSIFEEIRLAIRNDATDAQLVGLEEKYKGQVISGRGFVSNVMAATFTKGVLIYLLEEYNEFAIIKDVIIEITEDSPYLSIAKQLKKGQRISFVGQFNDIFVKAIYIKGTVKIIPE